MHPSLKIPPVQIVFRPYRGPDEMLKTENSLEVFCALERASRRALRVVALHQADRQLDAPSRAALNCYLRTRRIRRGGALPFYRSTELISRTRWLWEMFGRYLDFFWVE
jgi:hypothetical protein